MPCVVTIDPADDDPRGSVARQLNRHHALVMEVGKITVVTQRQDALTQRIVFDRSSVSDLRLWYANQAFAVPGEKRTVNPADAWLRSTYRDSYDALLFDPSGATLPANVYNLWRGLTVTPKAGDCQIFYDHLFEIGAAGDEATYTYLLDWIAFMLQWPVQPIETAIVWRGTPGAGKGTIARILGALYGQHFVHLVSLEQIVGRFRAHLQDAVFVFADEAMWAGDKSGIGAFKTLITEPTIAIERKGRDIVMCRNCCHVTMAANEEWAAPVTTGDRRFAIVDVPDAKRGDRPYFNRLHEHMSNGGLPAFAWDMLHRSIDGRPLLPDSVAARQSRLSQLVYSMSVTEKWWHERLTTGQVLKKLPAGETQPWGFDVPSTALHDDFLEFAEATGARHRATPMELAGALRRWVPTIRHGRKRDNGERVYYWTFPALSECRAMWSDYQKMALPWPQE